ncbi:MAG: right-handed parallel beta-helix repeat-containing protein, partial [Actinomycetota bacterium]|nr:right-handed parallel beta-helix repeat-containing protein [Actinomycetota bacterium]
AVRVEPGRSLQEAVRAHPEGTTFVLGAGVHRGQSVVPKRGNTFLGEAGAVLDGGGESRAFHGRVADVTIRGLVVQNYASADLHAAIDGNGSSGWVVAGNEVRHNRSFGIRVGTGGQVVGNYVWGNGRAGITGCCGRSGGLVEGNQLVGNGGDLSFDSGTRSAIKVTNFTDLVVRANSVHDNPLHGIWVDIDSSEVRIEDNLVVDNGGIGIYFEISYQGLIRRNTVEANATRGIFVSNSTGVEVTENLVRDNGDGISGFQGERGSGAHGPRDLRDLWVHHNLVTMSAGYSGITTTVAGDSVFSEWGNRFEANTYTICGVQEPFRWMGPRTIAEWQGLGHDSAGTWLECRSAYAPFAEPS